MNAKKKKYTNAGFVNRGQVEYRLEGEVLVTGILRSYLVDVFCMLLPTHILVDLLYGIQSCQLIQIKILALRMLISMPENITISHYKE